MTNLRTTLAALVTLCSILAPSLSFAQVDSSLPTEAFQSVYEVGQVNGLVVPTAVELPIDVNNRYYRQLLVVETGAGEQRPIDSEVIVDTNVIDIPVTVSVAGRMIPALTDGNVSTFEQFSVTDGEPSVTVLDISTAQAVTSDQIMMAVAANVSLPHQVSVSALTDTNNWETVVASRPLRATRVEFPVTTASQWRLELIHSQPLRLTEVSLKDRNRVVSQRDAVRWLAQPGRRYQVYLDADRSVSLPATAAVNLRSNEAEIQILPAVPKLANPAYTEADVDADGVPDLLDNCVSVANEDQLDIDGNNRGDACDDFDRDGVLNHLDNCPSEPNQRQTDTDGDDIGDACDAEESRLTEKHTWIPWFGLGMVGLLIVGMFAYVLLTPNGLQRREEERILSTKAVSDDLET